MAEPFYAGAYWGPRAESAAECSHRLSRCLSLLGQAHPLLAEWHRKGRSKSAASGLPVDAGSLTSLLAAGRNRTDVGGEVIPELGYSLALWNKKPVAVSFSTLCGANPSVATIKNSFVLELPPPTGEAAGLYEPSVAHDIVTAVIEAWQPEWATFASYAMRSQQNAGLSAPVVGWQTFLSGVDQAPPPCGVRVDGAAGGILVTAGPHPSRLSNNELEAAAGYVKRLVDRR